MKIQFWYSNSITTTGIQFTTETLYNTISFKNVDIDIIDTTKLNFLVFNWKISSTHIHSIEFIELLKELQQKDFYFIADYSHEAHYNTDELILSFLNKLKPNEIDINRLILATNSYTKIGLHRVKYGNFTLNTIFFPYFYLHTYEALNDYIGNVDINNSITPDKNFLCLNRRMYHHKYKIIEELFDRGLLNDTRFSWVDNKNPLNFKNKKLVTSLKININDFKAIQLEDDVMYGSELSTRGEYLYTINPNWYYKSKINIITETFLNELEIHITEKTWKAIYLGLPFVISASNGHLKTLKDMGFKTFDSVINEDYDSSYGKDKIKKIIDSAEELANIYNTPEVLGICKYNQQLYFNVEQRKKIFNEVFLNKLCDIQNLTIPKTLI
jgi:hypothetical protein